MTIQEIVANMMIAQLVVATINISQQIEKVNNNFKKEDQKMRVEANAEVRNTAKECGVFLWQVAAAIGINDGNFSRKLRRELPEQEKREILRTIHDLAAEKTEVV